MVLAPLKLRAAILGTPLSQWRLCVLCVVVCASCGDHELPTGDVAASRSSASLPAAMQMCARCHLIPPADTLPRARWRGMIERMSELTAKYSLGVPLAKWELDESIREYEARAPAELSAPEPAYSPSPILFQPLMLGAPPSSGTTAEELPIIGNVQFTDLDRDGHGDVVVSDVRTNHVDWIVPVGDGQFGEAILADLPAPARVEVFDANGDGALDIAVAVLGGIQPTEILMGQVVLLENDGQMEFKPRSLLTGVARVSDVRAADLDRDGDLDLLVAAFGAYRTGEIGWLEHQSGSAWPYHVLFRRNGVSHVPVADLDGDGDLDFVALISQEHEELVAFVNDGKGGFEPKLAFKAPHPLYGLSGVVLCDVDGDRDADIVFSNGDALDQDLYPKPWHGVRWLENRGGFEFQVHELVHFPGAYGLACGDLDGDGDVDLAVTSMMNRWEEPARQSIVWLENQRGKFAVHAVGSAPTSLVTAAIGDLDGDGLAEIFGGSMYIVPGRHRVGRVTCWRNAGRTH